MPDRPFDNPWPSPPVNPGGAPPAAVPYYDPAYIERVLAPTVTQPDDQGYTPGAVPPDTGVQLGDVANYAPGAVGDAYWGGGGYVGEDFYSPDRGKLSRAALNALLGEKSSGGWPGYGVIGSLSNLFYRRVRRTPAGIARKLVDELIRFGVRSISNRMTPRIPTPPTGGRALIPYGELPTSPTAGLALGLGVITGILALMYPRGMFAAGEAPIQPWERTGGAGPAGRPIPTNLYQDYGFPAGPRGFGIPPPSNAPPPDLSPPDLGPGGIPAPPGSPGWRQRFEQRLRERVQRSERELLNRIAPEPSRVPAQADVGPPYSSGIEGYTPPKQVTITPGTQGKTAKAPGVIRWGQLVGAIGVGTALESIRSGRSSLNPSVTSSPPLPTTPLSISSTQPLSSFTTSGFGPLMTTSSDCSCGRRGPRRKCLERAPVAWRGGRNKGKSAGTKCVRFASRRTAS